MKVALRVPPPLRATVRPLPVISPAEKLIVDGDGLTTGSGPRYTAQEFVELTTVTLPVTAVAFDGTPGRPLTWKVWGTLAWSLPLSPLPVRLSTIRTGVIGW